MNTGERPRFPGRRAASAAFASIAAAVAAGVFAAFAAAADATGSLPLSLRKRVETSPGGAFRVVEDKASWEGKQTAVIVCDMWAKHWCKGATDRGAEMAPRMNRFLDEARRRGALVIHAPSGGVDFYKDHPARKRAQSAPKAANLPEGIASWCSQIEAEKRESIRSTRPTAVATTSRSAFATPRGWTFIRPPRFKSSRTTR
jgi:hypothetical protein